MCLRTVSVTEALYIRCRYRSSHARQPQAPSAVLVRPDGYVAWVGDGSTAGFADAATTWFGAPAG
ncbi:MAG TPA: hypothetical protein VFP30_05040 [Candidatus Limnocylindria bacterium]|nr:hypothetical protein [Candidatus Limnocylindria bacterium]